MLLTSLLPPVVKMVEFPLPSATNVAATASLVGPGAGTVFAQSSPGPSTVALPSSSNCELLGSAGARLRQLVAGPTHSTPTPNVVRINFSVLVIRGSLYPFLREPPGRLIKLARRCKFEQARCHAVILGLL